MAQNFEAELPAEHADLHAWPAKSKLLRQNWNQPAISYGHELAMDAEAATSWTEESAPLGWVSPALEAQSLLHVASLA